MREAIERTKGGGGRPPMNMAAQLKSQRDNALQEEMRRIEEAAMDAYEKKDVLGGGGFKRIERTPTSIVVPQGMSRKQPVIDQDMGYMKPRKVGGGNGTFTLDDMKNED